MGNFWLKFKIWTKFAVVAAGFIYVILFVYFNASQTVHFWYWFRHQPQTNLLLLVFCSFLAGVIASFLARTTFRTIRQVRDMRTRGRMQRLDREMADMRSKAAMLQTKPPTGPESAPPPHSEHPEP